MAASGALNTLCCYGGAESSEEDETIDSAVATAKATCESQKEKLDQADDEKVSDKPAEATDKTEETKPYEANGKNTSFYVSLSLSLWSLCVIFFLTVICFCFFVETAGESTSGSPLKLKSSVLEDREYESDGSAPEEIPITKGSNEQDDSIDHGASKPASRSNKRKHQDSTQGEGQNSEERKNAASEPASKSKMPFQERRKENSNGPQSQQKKQMRPFRPRPPTLLEKVRFYRSWYLFALQNEVHY